jgi:sugar (pentulose or hexulose) kinase
MPPIANSGQFAAPINDAIAARTGLSSQLPVHVGIHDSNASLVPYLGESQEPFSVLSTGTWIIAMAVGGKEVVLNEHRDSLLNVNARGVAVPSARFMGGRERHDLLQHCRVDALAVEDIDRVLIQLLIKDVFVMPSHVKDTGPYPQATGKWTGNSTALTAAERSCAVALYLALMSEECLSLIGARGMTHVEGPMAHDSALTQMLAVATGRAVSLSESMTGTSAGAAMLIARPVQEIRNTLVDVPADRHKRLLDYATRWREHLHRHTQVSAVSRR